jgi:hypothetical protein
MTEKSENRDVLLVLGACTALFLLNFGWLLWVRHSNPEQLRSLANYPLIGQFKRLLLQPLSLLTSLIVLTSWIIAFLRSRKRTPNRTQRLVILALVLSTIFGLLLFTVFLS